MFFGVDPFDVSHSEMKIFPSVKHPSEREGYVANVQCRAGHLIQQRLEHVVVVFVDQNDLKGTSTQGSDQGQSGKSAPDDDDPFSAGLRNIQRHIFEVNDYGVYLFRFFETFCWDRSKESAVNGFFIGKVAFGSLVTLNPKKLIPRFWLTLALRPDVPCRRKPDRSRWQ